MRINKKTVMAFGLSIFGVFAVAFSLMQLPKVESATKAKADNEYTLTLNDGISVTDDYAVVTNVRGSEFEFKFSYYTAGSGKLGTVTADGEILNYTAFKSIQNISVSLSSGSVDIYYGWKQYENSDIEYNPSSSLTVTSTGNVDFSSISPSFFKLKPSATSVINSISITYLCSDSSSVSDLRIKVEEPTVGGTGSVSSTNYVWINTNVLNQSTWSNYVMTKDSDGSWYYDFEDVNVASSGYTYSLVVCDSNTVIDWTYPADTQSVGFGIGAGQTLFTISGVNFTSQPKVISSTYTLNLTINTSGTPSKFGNIQFVYNYTNSTSNYTWENYISYSWNSSYDYSFPGLDTSSTLYFRIYMWSDNTNIYVGNGSSNFSISPTGDAEINATVTFTYSVSSTITGTCVVDSSSSGTMSFANQTTTVYGSKITIAPTFSGATETFTASYSGENIRIDDNLYITGLKAGTTTKVTLTSQSGLQCSFNVVIPSSTYSGYNDLGWCGGSEAISVSEKWFITNKVSEISGMGSDFFNGIDISSTKALYDNGSKYYNSDGVEQSLFYILKDAGVNWIRLKLWVDPQTSGGVSYGGGESNLDNTLWMAYEAKAAGLNLLLDFHYSDYWTHPGQQIIPKSWNDCTSATKLQNRIKSYTTSTLTSFQNAGCLPDMVQLGNEISSGIYLSQYTGSSETFDSNCKPSYLTSKTGYGYGTENWSSYTNYIKAASEGVDAVDSSIKKVLHWAAGGSGTSSSVINSFFGSMPSAYYDYAAISFYPYYCFNKISDAQTILNGLSLSKPWFIAETSYPFTVGWPEHVSTNFTISNSNKGDTNIYSYYSFSPAGQANLIHALTSAVVTAGGKGIFYWEAAWIPNANVGWAGSGSKNTWGNQGFFSFDGKAIANLNLFKQMSPNI